MDELIKDIPLRLAHTHQKPGFALATTPHPGSRDRANTAIFSLISGVLLGPLPYANEGAWSCCASRPLAGRARTWAFP